MFNHANIGDLFYYKWNGINGISHTPVLVIDYKLLSGILHICLDWNYADRKSFYDETGWKNLKLIPAREMLK